MSSVTLHRIGTKVSVSLRQAADAMTGERVSLRELLAWVGEQGLLLFCILISLPFLLPISIPGSSVPFGFLILLVGVGIALDRIPWLPRCLLQARWSRRRVTKLLSHGAELFAKIERVVHQRVLVLTAPGWMSRLNGLVLCGLGLMLMIPVPFLFPLTNTIPAWGVLLLSAGILERDGALVLAGYALLLASIVYFAAIGVLMMFAGLHAWDHVAG